MKKIVTPLVSVVALITSQSVFGPVKGKNLMSSFSQRVQFKRKGCVLLNYNVIRNYKKSCPSSMPSKRYSYHELQGCSGMDGEIRSIDIYLTFSRAE